MARKSTAVNRSGSGRGGQRRDQRAALDTVHAAELDPAREAAHDDEGSIAAPFAQNRLDPGPGAVSAATGSTGYRTRIVRTPSLTVKVIVTRE